MLKGLPDDNGLFMPEEIPELPLSTIEAFNNKSISEIGFEVTRNYMSNDIPVSVLQTICNEAFNFPVPLVSLDSNTSIAELFHGPTLAFKDFGARFMARIMSYLNRDAEKRLTILVATSGDTGGAVADGFFGVDGIEVFILYPSGGVSELQEKQLTTYGNNIHAIEVKGTFDDCQHMVKSAFLDNTLSGHYRLTSANSINIARLIPQMIYYFAALAQFREKEQPVFIVPSGNFGNLTAGLFAQRMGLRASHFVAATNVNDSVPLYLFGKGFTPRASIATISNAMDVGNPSNFGRMLDLFKDSLQAMQKSITAYSISDSETESVLEELYRKRNYIADPHGAVGVAAWNKYRSSNPDGFGIILETAHPAKFIDTVERVLKIKLSLPEALEKLKLKQKNAVLLPKGFTELKNYLLSRV